jgi:hypothetical protein
MMATRNMPSYVVVLPRGERRRHILSSRIHYSMATQAPICIIKSEMTIPLQLQIKGAPMQDVPPRDIIQFPLCGLTLGNKSICHAWAMSTRI